MLFFVLYYPHLPDRAKSGAPRCQDEIFQQLEIRPFPGPQRCVPSRSPNSILTIHFEAEVSTLRLSLRHRKRVVCKLRMGSFFLSLCFSTVAPRVTRCYARCIFRGARYEVIRRVHGKTREWPSNVFAAVTR